MMRVLVLLFLILTACSQPESKTLPTAIASPGDLVVVADKQVWNGLTGDALRKTFSSEQPGLPQSEPWFRMIHFEEGKFNGISQRYRSILLVTTLDNDSKTSRYIKDLLGEKKYAEELTDSTLLFIQSKDRWAKGQQVLYLIGKDEKSLARAIAMRSESLLTLLNRSELDRMIASVKNGPRNKKAEKELNDKMRLKLAIPADYQLRMVRPDFFWITREFDERIMNVFGTLAEYKSQEQFLASSILAFRDSTTKVNIPGPTPGSWYTTEYQVSVDTQAMVFGDQYALKMRGLWRVENDFMGGPFIHTTLYDAANNRLIYLEGFVYYPKEKKRELLREVEGIIASLEL